MHAPARYAAPSTEIEYADAPSTSNQQQQQQQQQHTPSTHAGGIVVEQLPQEAAIASHAPRRLSRLSPNNLTPLPSSPAQHGRDARLIAPDLSPHNIMSKPSSSSPHGSSITLPMCPRIEEPEDFSPQQNNLAPQQWNNPSLPAIRTALPATQGAVFLFITTLYYLHRTAAILSTTLSPVVGWLHRSAVCSSEVFFKIKLILFWIL